MTTLELHNNFILFHEFNYGKEEPLKKWVRKDIEYIGHYHDDWNVLMPVVEKIESLADILEIKGIQCLIITFDGIDHVIAKTEKTKLASVYAACLSFIQWYNEQTKS